MDPASAAILLGWANADELEPLAVPKIDDEREPPWHVSRHIDGPALIDPASIQRPASSAKLTLHATVLLGLTGQEALKGAVRRRLHIDPDREPATVTKADCFCAAVAVDTATRRPIPATFAVSHLVALLRRLAGGDPELRRALTGIPAYIREEGGWLDRAVEGIEDTDALWSAMLERWRKVAAGIGPPRDHGVGLLIGEWTRPDQEPDAVALQSFFAPALRDLVRGGTLNDTLVRYLSAAPRTEPMRKIDVADPRVVIDRLGPGAGPPARWPSGGRGLTTTQRFAACRIADRMSAGGGDIVAINGPPGTGKSTLLCELVAQQLVRRAEVIVELGPDVALPRSTCHGRRTFAAHPAVSGSEIVVAAATNRAVTRVADVLNGVDAVPPNIPETYLTGPGAAMEHGWWALIAMVLGNRGNIRGTTKVLAPRPPTEPWSAWLDGLPSWEEASRRFRQASALVRTLEVDVARRAAALGAARRALGSDVRSRDDTELVDELRRASWRCDEQVAEHHATRPGWLARQLDMPAWRRWVLDHEATCARRQDVRATLTALEDNGSRPPVLSGDAWMALDDSAEQERRPPGVDVELEDVRCRRFLAALDVHGAALATRVPEVAATISTWAWSLDSPGAFTRAERRALWRSAFVVVPAVTTTFASAARLLEAFGLDELGIAVVDEAGQAAAHEAVPLLSKVRRAVIVGDQQQLEPVVTLEPELLRPVMAAACADERFSPDQASVQHLADAGSTEGTAIITGPDRTWVGLPLRGHFRCADPMFAIANTISYGGTMIRLRDAMPSSHGSAALATTWIDVPLAAGTHWGADDRRALLDLLDRFAEPPGDDVFVIAPFRQVVAGAQRAAASLDGPPATGDELRPWGTWARRHIGTVHTFQGQEADTVILVLSADAARPKARSWVANPPNLLNVAVTRAREHLIVIGNRAAWSNEPVAAELVAGVAAAPTPPPPAAQTWPPPQHVL